MQRLMNTGHWLMYLGTNRFSGKVDGTSTRERHERQFLNFEWIEMSVLDHDFYHLVAGSVLTSHEYWNNLAVEAAVLAAKHYWATHSPLPEPKEVLVLTKLPSAAQLQTPARVWASRIHVGILLLLWLVSGIGLIAAQRSGPSAARHDAMSGFVTRIYLIAVGLAVFAALRLPVARTSWPDILFVAVFLFVVGRALQLYARIQLRSLERANPGRLTEAGANGPHYFFWRLSAAGGLLAVIGLGLSFNNWASLLIIGIPCCMVTLWRNQTLAGFKKMDVPKKNDVLPRS
jgi:hypothetical protein